MIARGRLLSFQREPGRNGSPHLLSKRLVELLRDDPKRRKHRAAWEKGATFFGKTEPGEGVIEPLPNWLTTRQVQRCLGVSEARVHYLRRSGRIYAYARVRVGTPGGPRWLHRKEDVAALLADAQFQKKRAGWKKAQITSERRAIEWMRRINGWDRPDHLPDYAMPKVW